MKIIIRVIPLLLLVGLAAPFTFTNTKIEQTFGGAKLIRWNTTTVISAEDFPCELDGPVRHPKNCSQFYRCLKISTKSNIYNRYLYECPKNYVYFSRELMCVLGKCVGDVIEQSSSGTGSTGESGTGSTGESGPDIGQGSIRETEVDSGPGSAVESCDDDSGTTGGSKSSSSVNELPSVIDQPSNVISSEDIETPQSEECKTYLYVQVVEYCNLFRRCNDTQQEVLYMCVRGTGFKTSAQMCRIAAFDEFICLGKKIFEPKESLFREVFNMDQVVVVPLDESSVANAYPFVFTNYSTWLESAPPHATKPMALETLLRFAEFSRDEKPSTAGVSVSNTGLGTEISQVGGGQKPVGTGSKLTSFIPEDYQLVAAIQYPLQITNPYDFSGTGLAQQFSGVQQATGSQYAIPVFISGFQSPVSASTTPSFTFSNQATPLHQTLRQYSWPSSGVSSSYANVFPFGAYSHPSSAIRSPYTPTYVPSSSYSPYVSSPQAGVFQWPYSLSSLLSSPSNYLSSQTQNSFIPGPIHYKAPYQSVSANPYETFQFKPIQDSDPLTALDASKQKITDEKTPVLKQNTFYDPTDIHTFLYDPASTEIDSIQSRSEDGEGYHVIPLSKEDIISLVEHNIRSQTSQYDEK